MKKIFGLMLLCAISTCLSSCSGCSSSNDPKDNYRGGGRYTSPDGGRQSYYQGSIEQQRDLDAIDAYFNEHGWD